MSALSTGGVSAGVCVISALGWDFFRDWEVGLGPYPRAPCFTWPWGEALPVSEGGGVGASGLN